jgi:hypothetical protein
MKKLEISDICIGWFVITTVLFISIFGIPAQLYETIGDWAVLVAAVISGIYGILIILIIKDALEKEGEE